MVLTLFQYSLSDSHHLGWWFWIFRHMYHTYDGWDSLPLCKTIALYYRLRLLSSTHIQRSFWFAHDSELNGTLAALTSSPVHCFCSNSALSAAQTRVRADKRSAWHAHSAHSIRSATTKSRKMFQCGKRQCKQHGERESRDTKLVLHGSVSNGVQYTVLSNPSCAFASHTYARTYTHNSSGGSAML